MTTRPGVEASIRERLSLALFLYSRASSDFKRIGMFGAGITTSQLQDAVETFLRVGCEYGHASVRENASFDQLVETLWARYPGQLTHRASLGQLNKARVAFKHFGLEPRRENVEKFLADVGAFLPRALSQVFGLTMSDVSLVRLVGHRRVENHLRQAEQALRDGDYREAITRCACAFEIYRSKVDDFQQTRRSPLPTYRMDENLRAISEQVSDLHEQVEMIGLGVDLVDLIRFRSLAPEIRLAMAGNWWLGPWPTHDAELQREDVEFCLAFTVRAILAMKSNHVRSSRYRPPQPDLKMTAIETAPIVQYPPQSRLEDEVIWTAEVGETLLSFSKAKPREGFLPVADGDEIYYVRSKSVRIEEPTPQDPEAS